MFLKITIHMYFDTLNWNMTSAIYSQLTNNIIHRPLNTIIQRYRGIQMPMHYNIRRQKLCTYNSCCNNHKIYNSRGSRISARGGCQGIDDLIWDGDERFLTYVNTDLQLFKMFIAILCLNGVTTTQGTPVSLLSVLETKEPAPSARVPPSHAGVGAGPSAPPPWIRACIIYDLRRNVRPSFNYFKSMLLRYFETERYLATNNGKMEHFKKKWNALWADMTSNSDPTHNLQNQSRA